MKIAVTRKVSPGIVRCELTHMEREPIDVERARRQHEEYEACLRRMGCAVHAIPADPGLPDSVFVEDIAVVLKEVAVLTRPGAESRRGETPAVAEALAEYRETVAMEGPGTLDGGDVLANGKTIYVGRSTRTSDEGIAALAAITRPFGYAVRPVPVGATLHLKSAANLVGPNTLLIHRGLVGAEAFEGLRLIDVDEAEPAGAHALWIGEKVLLPAANLRTEERLRRAGVHVLTVDISELAKAEAGVTCCSLVFEV
jgi:dimethylargininase